MGKFSTDMRKVAKDLIAEFGNKCKLTLVTKGTYDPAIGEAPQTIVAYDTYSAPSKDINMPFGLDGTNTNLSGFSETKVIIPWFGVEVDEAWLYDDSNILLVEPTKTQDDIVIYTLTVGEHK